MFQFHKVRLKGRRPKKSRNFPHVSIPQGTIKSTGQAAKNCLIHPVSIPQGTIKRQVLCYIHHLQRVFQFHKVRLKGLKYERCDC